MMQQNIDKKKSFFFSGKFLFIKKFQIVIAVTVGKKQFFSFDNPTRCVSVMDTEQ